MTANKKSRPSKSRSDKSKSFFLGSTSYLFLTLSRNSPGSIDEIGWLLVLNDTILDLVHYSDKGIRFVVNGPLDKPPFLKYQRPYLVSSSVAFKFQANLLKGDEKEFNKLLNSLNIQTSNYVSIGFVHLQRRDRTIGVFSISCG